MLEKLKGLPFYQLVIFATFLVNLLPLSVGAFRFKKLSYQQKNMLLLVVIWFVLDGIGRILWINATSNLFLGHAHTLLEFLLLTRVFYLSLGSFAPRRFFPIVGLSFTLLAVANTIFVQALDLNNSYIKLLESLLLISFSLMYFFKVGKEMKISRPENEPMFWISTAVLIYFSGSIFIFLNANFILLYSEDLGIRIWFIHAVFFILFSILITISFWKNQKR